MFALANKRMKFKFDFDIRFVIIKYIDSYKKFLQYLHMDYPSKMIISTRL